MAGAMRKVAVYLGLVEDRDRYDEQYDDYEDDYVEEFGDDDDVGVHDLEPGPPERRAREHTATVASLAERRAMSAVRRNTAPREARITTQQPRTHNDAGKLGEHFRDGIPVIMNLSEMED